MNTFGSDLASLRRAAGLSQSALAERAGCDHSHISRLETGHRMPTREMVLTLAMALDLGPRDRDRLLLSVRFAPGRRIESPVRIPKMEVDRRVLLERFWRHTDDDESTHSPGRQTLRHAIEAIGSQRKNGRAA